MSSIEIPASLDECPLCSSAFENIAHPRSGAIMMRICKCKITLQPTEFGVITVMTSPEEDEK